MAPTALPRTTTAQWLVPSTLTPAHGVCLEPTRLSLWLKSLSRSPPPHQVRHCITRHITTRKGVVVVPTCVNSHTVRHRIADLVLDCYQVGVGRQVNLRRNHGAWCVSKASGARRAAQQRLHSMPLDTARRPVLVTWKKQVWLTGRASLGSVAADRMRSRRTKNLDSKSETSKGSRERPQTKRRNRDRSSWLNDSRACHSSCTDVDSSVKPSYLVHSFSRFKST